MKPAKIFAFVVAANAALATQSYADAEFNKIETKSDFVGAINGKQLTLTGIRLTVTPDGAIKGRAYGRNVTGKWTWTDNYFCRDLYWGKTDLGPNCQEVKVAGNKIRFTSDRGTGRYAVLKMR